MNIASMDTDKMMDKVLSSASRVHLLSGKPGVGKTYFGCCLADYALHEPAGVLRPFQRVLFLTFSRNAVARIKETFLNQLEEEGDSPDSAYRRERKDFENRVRVNTFHGFFWWLIESYGRYAPSGFLERPWLLGSVETGQESLPYGYHGYTFDNLQSGSLAVLRVKAVRGLVSELYPLVIVDEFQDVSPQLLEVIILLGDRSQLVLLTGPGQCVYRGLKQFDPQDVLRICRERLRPDELEIVPDNQDKQRYCSEIAEFVRMYDAGNLPPLTSWPVIMRAVPRMTASGNPRQIETEVALLVREMEGSLRNSYPNAPAPSIGVLCSTNDGVAAIYRRLTTGSEAYNLAGRQASLYFNDALLLQYGRFLLTLLPGHWITADNATSSDNQKIAGSLASLFKEGDSNSDTEYLAEDWVPLAEKILEKARAFRSPQEDQNPVGKLGRDIDKINEFLRATRNRLPKGSPPTPFDANQTPLLEALKKEFLVYVRQVCVGLKVDVSQLQLYFERSMQRRAILEKMGIQPRVQAMTIHKAKGREFDGVVLALEYNRKALWRKSARKDEEVDDLYRVAITRARRAFAFVGFEDIRQEAASPVKKLLPVDLFLEQHER